MRRAAIPVARVRCERTPGKEFTPPAPVARAAGETRTGRQRPACPSPSTGAGLCSLLAVHVDRTALVSLHSLIEAAGDPVQALDDFRALGREVLRFLAVGVEIV